MQSRVGTFAEVFWKEIIVAAGGSAHWDSVGAAVDTHAKAKSISSALNLLVNGAAQERLSQIGVQVRHAFLRLRGYPRLLPRWDFEEIAVGPHQFATLDVYEYLHDVLA